MNFEKSSPTVAVLFVVPEVLAADMVCYEGRRRVGGHQLFATEAILRPVDPLLPAHSKTPPRSSWLCKEKYWQQFCNNQPSGFP